MKAHGADLGSVTFDETSTVFGEMNITGRSSRKPRKRVAAELRGMIYCHTKEMKHEQRKGSDYSRPGNANSR